MSFKKFLLFCLLTCWITTLFACKPESKSENSAAVNVENGNAESKDVEIEVPVLSIDSVNIPDVEDGKTYQTIRYTVVTCKNNQPLQESLDILNANMKKEAEDFKSDNKEGIRDFIKEVSDMPDAEFAHTSDIAIARNDKRFLSLTEFVYENMMGAHGNYVQNGHTYDVKTGQKLGLYDFVKDKEELRKFLKDWADKHADDMGLFDEVNDTIDAYVDGKYELQFYIGNNNLIVMFQPYDVAPYAAGLIEVDVDDELLKVKP